jgi:hypothetical protein
LPEGISPEGWQIVAGGRSEAKTTGYFLATLQVASLHFKLESTNDKWKISDMCNDRY